MPRRDAFTLLEVLLALALGSMLMVGLFSMLRVQGRIAREGGRVVEQAQLARGLLEQIADEVRASVRPMTSPGQALPQQGIPLTRFHRGTPRFAPATLDGRLRSASANARDDWPEPLRTLAERSDLPAVGLFGDAECLVVSGTGGRVSRLRLSGQMAKWERSTLDAQLSTASPDPQSHSPTRSLAHSPFGSDGRFAQASAGVAYFAVQDRSPGAVSNAMQPLEVVDGLARLELARSDPETATERLGDALQTLKATIIDTQAGPERKEEPLLSDEDDTPTALDIEDEIAFTVPGLHAVVLAPEVRWLRFRYLGDYGWQDAWTSHANLPRAVEIAVGLATDDFQRRDRPSPAEDRRLAGQEDQPEISLTNKANERLAGTEGLRFESPYPDAVRQAGLQVYRLVVCVPTAANERVSEWGSEQVGLGAGDRGSGVGRGLGNPESRPQPARPLATEGRRP